MKDATARLGPINENHREQHDQQYAKLNVLGWSAVAAVLAA